MPDTTKLSREDERNLRRLLQALDLFAALQPQHKEKQLPLDMLRVFLTVALNEGEGAMKFAEVSKVKNTTVSRHLHDLGELDRYQNAGLELVYQKVDVRDKRRRPTYLTPEGRSFLRRLIDALKS